MYGPNELAVSYGGDLQIFNNDIRIMTGADCIARTAIRWCMLGKGRWEKFPFLGTNLESYIGMINNEQLLDRMNDEMNIDINKNNYFGGTSFSFKIINAWLDNIYAKLYILTPEASIETFMVSITTSTIDTSVSGKDPYDPPMYFPTKTHIFEKVSDPVYE